MPNFERRSSFPEILGAAIYQAPLGKAIGKHYEDIATGQRMIKFANGNEGVGDKK